VASVCPLPSPPRENLFNASESRTLPTEYHPSFFIPAKTQHFTHSQGNISSTFGQENTITKISKKLNVFFKNKRDLGVFISIFFASKESW